MSFDLNGYRVHEGVVEATKGSTIWLKDHISQMEIPVSLANATVVDHIRPGHELRVLVNTNNVVTRVVNKATDITYEVAESSNNPTVAKAAAFKTALLCSIPLFNMLIAPFIAISIFGYSMGAKGPARGKRLSSLLKTVTAFCVVLFGGFALSLASPVFMVIPLLGPGVVVYMGMMKLHEIEVALAAQLTQLAKTAQPVAFVAAN